jgi:hypothetical protein
MLELPNIVLELPNITLELDNKILYHEKNNICSRFICRRIGHPNHVVGAVGQFL